METLWHGDFVSVIRSDRRLGFTRLTARFAACVVLILASGQSFASDGKTVLPSAEDGKTVLPPEGPVTESRPEFRISAEYHVEGTYIGGSDVSREADNVRDFEESNVIARFVLTPRVAIGILRLGAGYERYDFSFEEDGWPLPDTLQAGNLIVGLDTQFSDSILFRIEAQPGLYGAGMDEFETDDFNVPFIAGGTYIYSPTLQFVLGVSFDVDRQFPVLPGGGLRWKFAPQWVLNAVLPTPRLEHEFNGQFTAYTGAVVKTQTFRMTDEFGNAGGNPALDHAVLDYSEVRTGLGFDWKIAPALTFTGEAGYLVWREFDFHRTEVRYHHEQGAPYGTISLHGAF